MYDPVFGVTETEKLEAELAGVVEQRFHLIGRYRILNGFILIVGGDIVVGRTVCALGAHHFQSAAAQTLESLRTCHLVAIMTVNIELVGTVFNVVYHMSVPYFVEKSL